MESFFKIIGIILWELIDYITLPTKDDKRERKRKKIQRKKRRRDGKKRNSKKEKLNKVIKFIIFYLILIFIHISIEHIFNREITFLKSFIVPFVVTILVFTFGSLRNENSKN